MKQVQWFALATGSVTLAMVAAISPAEAATITYGLQGVTLNYLVSGVSTTGTLTGTFDFDDVTGSYSNISLTSSYTGTAYSGSIPGGSPNQLSLLNSGSTAFLNLSFASPLGSLPSIAINTFPSSFEINFATPANVSSFAQINGGSVVAIPTPVLLPSLIGLGVTAFRKRKAALASAEAKA